MAAIMGIKFQSLVVETMIREYVQVPATQSALFNTCSMSTMETSEQRRYGAFIINLEQISQADQVLPLWILSK